MKKILIPTDFSTTASNAFVYALHLAKNIDAEILILHSYEMPIISTTSSGQPDLVQGIYETIELNNFDKYKNEVPALNKLAEDHNLSDIKLTFLFEEGMLLTNIKRIIEQENVNFVVMGTDGNHSLEKKLLGSNTVNIINNIKVPILSVPGKAKFKSLNTFGFATLLNESDKEGINQIIDISQRIGGEVKLLHVLRKENREIVPLIKKWKDYFDNDKVKIYTVLNPNLEDSVFYFIDEHLIDVMCIVKRQLNFFERIFTSSLSKQLSYHSDIPVLILPQPKPTISQE